MKTIVLAVSFLIFGSSPGARAQQAQNDLKVGDIAPRFALPYATKDSISRSPLSLSDLIGKRAVVLAFYPADWSTGCTKEVCTLRDNFEAFRGLDAEVLAISGDYVWSHREWAKALNLPFKLLSDHAHVVAKLYGSYNEKSLYNRRTVFVVDKQGKISYSNLEYRAGDLNDFEKLKSALADVR